MSFCASRWIDGKNRFCAGWEFREAERSIAAGGVLKVMSGANVRMGHGVSKVSYVWGCCVGSTYFTRLITSYHV